ncbi:MAG TPA: hypothetical protein P5516_08965 [Anaerolineaceae bacterium]|nr:hypothetical protein [Anaerolineaceae bacterium]
MPKPKNEFPSVRVRLDGYLQMREEGVTADPRQQALYNFLVEHRSDRKAFPMAIELLTAALNGELGEQVKTAVEAGDTQAAVEAARDLISEFVIDI